MISIRKAIILDIPRLKELYMNTVLCVNRKDYSIEEIKDWASCGDDERHWQELIANLFFIVAENENKQIVGFSSISQIGYLHSMFIHKDFQRQGIASLLYQAIEDFAINNNISLLISDVSITAKSFFEKQGFKVDEKKIRKANRLNLTNYKMSKQLFNIDFI